MTLEIKQLLQPTLVSTGTTTIYTVPNLLRVLITRLSVNNPQDTDGSITIHAVMDGGVPSIVNQRGKNIVVKAEEHKDLFLLEGFVLEERQSIAVVTTGAALSFFMTGVVIT